MSEDTITDILKERGKRYGDFSFHGGLSQEIKYAMRAHRSDPRQPPSWGNLRSDQKEALEMIAHKIARILNGDPNYSDSWRDIAGYATLIADGLEGDKE